MDGSASFFQYILKKELTGDRITLWAFIYSLSLQARVISHEYFLLIWSFSPYEAPYQVTLTRILMLPLAQTDLVQFD